MAQAQNPVVKLAREGGGGGGEGNLVSSMPGCVCQKMKEMGPLSTSMK